MPQTPDSQTPSPPPPGNSPADQIPDDDSAQTAGPPPVSLSASVVLSSLPTDTTRVLERLRAAAAASAAATKVVLRLKPIGAAPPLRQPVYRISGNQTVASLVKFLRRQLRCGTAQSVFCYINNSFAPALDEPLINLHEMYATEGTLLISYCYTVAFG